MKYQIPQRSRESTLKAIMESSPHVGRKLGKFKKTFNMSEIKARVLVGLLTQIFSQLQPKKLEKD